MAHIDSRTSEEVSEVMSEAIAGVYDEFYARRYDGLFHDTPNGRQRFAFETAAIRQRWWPSPASVRARLLDLGCGTGRHCAAFAGDAETVGVDSSPSMLDIARLTSPQTMFVEADMCDPGLFAAASFTHVVSLYGAIHYTRDLESVLANIGRWLQPGGLACLGILDPSRLSAATLPTSHLVDDEMVTWYPDCQYRSRWERRTGNRVYYHETFLLPWLETVERHHEFYMPEVNALVDMAARNGLHEVDRVPMDPVECEDELLVFFSSARPSVEVHRQPPG